MKWNEQDKSIQFTFGNYISTVYISKEGALVPLLKAPEGIKILSIFDQNTAPLFGDEHLRPLSLPLGEEHKSWESINQIMQRAVRENLARDSILAGIGGGIVCDMVAFAASIYMRGCQLRLIPTTLLAMVDASLGGKTGINFMGYKNMVGTFYPASSIHICLNTLVTLPENEFQTGLAEVIKTAMIGDKELFQLLIKEKERIFQRDTDLMEEIVKRCILVKGKIVEEDFKEKGLRAYLNLGHTFGHALEAVADFKGWSHGQAVAWGMAKAMDLGVRLGLTDPGYAEQVKNLLRDYRFRITVDNLAPEEIITAMSKDKKKLKDKLRFILQKDLNKTFISETDLSLVKEIIN
jgi:3-dehydroquinate synthase